MFVAKDNCHTLFRVAGAVGFTTIELSAGLDRSPPSPADLLGGYGEVDVGSADSPQRIRRGPMFE